MKKTTLSNAIRRTFAPAVFVAVGPALAGCGALPDASFDTALATTPDPLYYVSNKIWSQRDIPVCWVTSGNATEKEWVRQALRGQRSWSAAGNVNFVGWGACASGAVGIKISAGSSMATSYLSRTDSGIAEMTLDFGGSVHTGYSRCSVNGLSREQCIKTVAIHEFGHAIGYAHEHNRPDTPGSCTSAPQGTNGNATFGPFDGLSIMAYCDFATQLSGFDRRGNERLYKQSYGDAPRMADYNGDGRSDLLCHDVTNGTKWADYADGAGRFGGSDWSRAANWCNHDAARLFTGDFNGDGRDDILCHDVANGTKWVDYADGSGQFLGTDWSRAANWCNHETARLFVGDFNGDGRDDMLCHDVANGTKWVDYADGAGQFLGTDWSRAANWCNHDTAELHIGDFNGDGRDDMLCHDVANGTKWIDYADGSGQFLGTDWSRAANWCNHSAARLHIGDINGDGRDDMLCHDVANGTKWIDYADGSGQFLGSDWSLAANWCSHEGGELH
jgi:hypothetical protein